MNYIKGSTKVFGLIGDPVEHSLSPEMHNAAFQKLNLNNIYLAFKVIPQDLARAVEGIRALNIQGVNVTAPHKESVLPFLNELSEECSIVGAVNTVKNHHGKLTGDNTDGAGFVTYLKEELKLDLRGKNAVLVGIGGAAKSIAYNLCKEGVEKLVIANRTLEKAEQFAALLHEKTKRKAFGIPLENNILNASIKKCDLLIYTLPGDIIQQGKLPFDPALIPLEALLIDLRYYPQKTALMKAAEERGVLTRNGLGMLLHQGILAFNIFTAQKPPVDVMKSVVFK